MMVVTMMVKAMTVVTAAIVIIMETVMARVMIMRTGMRMTMSMITRNWIRNGIKIWLQTELTMKKSMRMRM